MTVHVATSLIAFISYGGLLALVSRYGLKGNRSRQMFSLYLLDMLLLQVAYLMVSLADNEQKALSWYTLTVPLAMGQMAICFFFVKELLGLKQPRKLLQASTIVSLSVVTLGVLVNPIIILASIHRDEATGLYVPEISALAGVLAIPILLFLGVIVLDLVQGYKSTRSPLQRVRIQYLLLAIVIVWVGIMANASLSLRPYPVDVAANIVSAFLIAYAILRYQLLDINIVFRRGLLFSVSVLMMGIGYLIAIFLATKLGHFWEESHSLLLYFGIAIIAAILVIPLQDRVQRWIDQVFFKEKYDSGLMIQRLGHTAASILDLDKLARTILDDITKTMQVQWAALLLEQDGDFQPGARTGSEAKGLLSLSADHPVVWWLSSHATIMTTDSLDELLSRHILTRQQLDELDRIGIELLVPLKARDALVGILSLGARLSRRGYSQDDERTLTILANQVAIAIDNARLYERNQQELVERRRIEHEREALIAELEAKNKELEQFTYTVSHDLRSPLITLRGFLGFLDKDISSGNVERARADMARIVEATDKMQRLLEELLALSRVGRMMNVPQAVPFESIAREAIELVRGRITARGVHVEIEPGLPTIYGDRTRLIQVVQNLVDNACKFMGDQAEPCIEIGVQARDGKPVFFVRDNGIGIEPQDHQQVFGLFNKLDTQTEGTGVGLALVKRIIEVHGGRIWVESEGMGKGSTFYFTLPDSREKVEAKL